MNNTTNMKAVKDIEVVSKTERIEFKERVSFGIGDFGTNLMYALMVTFLTYFYTNVVGISAALTGTIMFGARVLDGILNLIVGTLMDRTDTKHGKARPWILWTAIPFGLTGFLMSTIPNIGYNGKVAYVIITYLLANIFFQANNIPYGSLVSLITRDTYERSVLSIFRNFFSTIGSMTVGIVTLPLIAFLGNTQKAWIITFGVYGFLTSLCLIITFLGTKERVKPVRANNKEKFTFSQVVYAVKKNKYWAMIFAYLFITFVTMTAVSTVNVYYAEYILKNPMIVSFISLAQSLPAFLVLFIISPLIRRFGKRNIALLGLSISLIGYLLPLIDKNSVSLLIIATVLKGIGGAPIGATMFAFLADTIDYGEWVSGLRIEGILFSAGTLGQTLGMGVGTALVGWILGAVGFASGSQIQNENVITTIALIFIFLPAILTIINIIILMFYKLENIFEKISADLSIGKLREK